MIKYRREILGGAGRGSQDNDVARMIDGSEQFTEHSLEPGTRRIGEVRVVLVRARTIGRNAVHELVVYAKHLDGAQFVEVARQRRLGDFDPDVSELNLQVGL